MWRTRWGGHDKEGMLGGGARRGEADMMGGGHNGGRTRGGGHNEHHVKHTEGGRNPPHLE